MSDVRLTKLIAPTFQPVHRAIKNHECAEVWLKGGRGSTKSSFLAIELILELMRRPEAHAIVYRKVAATLRESVYEQIIRAAGWLGVESYFECRLSPLEIRYRPTGQRILFRGADDPAKSKSIALRKGFFGVIWFEELAEFRDADAIRTIRASVIRGGYDTLTFYSYVDGRLRGVEGQICEQAVWNATQTATVSCIGQQLAQLQGVLGDLTKVVIPNGSVCPGWGDVKVSIEQASSSAS